MVLSTWPCKKYFSHPSLVIYFFANPHTKTETWWLLIANHLDQSLWWANQKHWVAVNVIFSILYSTEGQCCCAFYWPPQSVQIASFFWIQTGKFWRFFSQFYCARSHTEHLWRCSYNLKGIVTSAHPISNKVLSWSRFWASTLASVSERKLSCWVYVVVK